MRLPRVMPRRSRPTAAGCQAGGRGRGPASRCGRRSRTSSRSSGRAPTTDRHRGRGRSTSPGRPRWCRWSGGMARCSIDSSTAAASSAPAAPSGWPVTPLVDVTIGPGVPKTLAMASASAASFSDVEVPWALMWTMSRGPRPASTRAISMQATAPGTPGRRGGDVVGVGGAGRPEDLAVDVGAAGLGHLELLEQQDGGAFGQDEAVTVGVERSAEAARRERGHVPEAGHRR